MKKFLLAVAAALTFAGTAFAAVDLNTANQQQLEALKGIGPEKAKAIIDYRTKNGPFKTVDELTKVPGIKEGTLSKIKSDVTVGGKPAPAAKPAATPAATPAPAAKPADAKKEEKKK